MKIIPVVLAGGSGSRLWPASRPDRPKQFLPLTGGAPLLAQTCRRVEPLGDVLALTVEGQHGDVARVAGLDPERILVEPVGRNTGPAIAWTLHELAARGPDAVAVFFPSDHLVRDAGALRESVRRAAAAALGAGCIGLLGVRPDRPETGYGYVQAGAAAEAGAFEVMRFIEKPDAVTAGRLLAQEDVYWNSGIFIVPLAVGLDIVRAADDGLAGFLDRLPPAGDGCRPKTAGRDALAAAYATAPPVPFDVAVMERTRRRRICELDAGWSDLGSWQAVWEAGEADGRGNVLGPGARAVDADGCLVTGDGRTVAVLGVRDLVVVAWGDAVLVCPRERAQDVRRLTGSEK